MDKATLALTLLFALGLRIVAITLAIVIMAGWPAARAVGHLGLWAFARSKHGLG